MADHSECSQGGAQKVYVPEYFHDDKWNRIPVGILKDEYAALGIPYPRFMGGVLRDSGTFSKHQAIALAHHFAAKHESSGEFVEVRVAEYELKYEWSVKRLPEVKK